MLSKIRILFLLHLILSAGLLNSCKNSAKATEITEEVTTPVTITPVTYKAVSSYVTLPATATFLTKSIIRATTAGNIEKVLINQGDFINAGQLLFTIKTREAMALDKNITADTALRFTGIINIKAPLDGIVNTVSHQTGDFVQEGDEMAIVSDQKSLVFILDVPYELDKYIAKNRNCIITLPDSNQVRGAVINKLAEMDIAAQTVRYIVKPVASYRIPGNLIANIRIIKATTDKATVLPKQAVLGNETQTEFWVMKLTNDSTAVRTDVKKGIENNDEVEITSPQFLPSDRIILTGNYGLPDTARITIMK